MESKESARLKDIDGRLKGIEVQLREQNKQLKRIADIFGKQWHGDATATSNGDKVVITPFANIDTAFANLKEGIEKAADELKR